MNALPRVRVRSAKRTAGCLSVAIVSQRCAGLSLSWVCGHRSGKYRVNVNCASTAVRRVIPQQFFQRGDFYGFYQVEVEPGLLRALYFVILSPAGQGDNEDPFI
jgi:hypothetical protein